MTALAELYRSRLIDSAIPTTLGPLQVRAQGDVYTVTRAPYRASRTLLFVTRSLDRAREWREARRAGAL